MYFNGFNIPVSKIKKLKKYFDIFSSKKLF
jgi:hypothetical protein